MKHAGQPLERRKHKRFCTKNRSFAVVRANDLHLKRFDQMSMGQIAFAVYKSHPAKVGQIVDLSRGGLSFRYIDKKRRPETRELNVDILSADDGFYLGELAFKTVGDEAFADERAYSPFKIKEQRVKFTALTSEQKQRLEGYLKSAAHGKSGNNRNASKADKPQ